MLLLLLLTRRARQGSSRRYGLRGAERSHQSRLDSATPGE